jgi:hypothetical protein
MRWLLIGVVAVMVAGAVVAFLVVARGRDDKAPEIASGPGVFRVHPQFRADGGQRAPEEITYEGTTFKVGFGGAFGSGDDLTAALVVTRPEGTVRPTAKYSVGATIEVDGATLKVRGIHPGKSDLDDLVDVQIIPPKP